MKKIRDGGLNNWRKRAKRMISRANVYRIIDTERVYQEEFNSRVLSVGEELTLLQCYISKAFNEYADTLNVPSEPATMDVVRKIAGICVRAMENHGAIERELRE